MCVWLKGLRDVELSLSYPGTYAEDDVDGLVKEFLQMKQLQHPNVMGLIGVCLDAGPAPYIVLPFMANGNLLSYLKQRRSTLLLSKTADEDEVCLHTYSYISHF